MPDTQDAEPTFEQILEQARLLSMPIDFEGLVNQGVLKRDGSWYEILQAEHVPQHVMVQVKAMRTRKTDEGSHLQIQLPKSNATAMKLYESLKRRIIR